jgi:predicted Zn-dependent protease
VTSQTATLPPPPIGPKDSSPPYLRYVVFAVVGLLGLLFILELRLVNSPAGKEAAQRIRGDARVRAEFGDNIQIPVAWGWTFQDRAEILAYVSGNKGHGSATVNLREYSETWLISQLEVRNPAEGHLINLAKPSAPATPEQLKGLLSGTLYFVALGELANEDVGELAAFFEKEFGIAVKTLPPMSLPGAAYDSRRKQWVAEMLARSIEEKYPEIAGDPDARVVGILEDDTYIRSFNWAFTYSYRENNKHSVVPTARLDPSFTQFPANAAIRMERLRKVAMKAVGLTYLGFAESTDPQSVDAIEASIEDIDRMGSVYLASDVRTRPSVQNTDGTPCLTFFSANVAGAPLRKPIAPCWQYRDDSETSQFQINLAQGKFQATRNDLYRGGPVPLQLVRMNFSTHFDDRVRAFGKSSWQSLDDTVWSSDPNSIQTISINGVLYDRIAPGNGFSAAAKYRAGANEGNFSYALLSWYQGGWRIDTRDGEVWKYLGCGPSTPVPCYFMGATNLAGDGIVVDRDVTTTGRIQKVSQQTNANFPEAAAHDHTWTPVYDGERITEIHDSDGGTARYVYDPDEYLTDVEADGHHVHYDYNGGHRITRVVEDGRAVQIHYDAEGRADRVELPNGSMNIRYSGESIEVDAKGRKYSVTIMPSYFRVMEEKVVTGTTGSVQ